MADPGHHGRFFVAPDAGLARIAQDMDDYIVRHFPQFVVGSASTHVVLHPDQLTGRGVALADGVRFPRGTALGLYFGDILEEAPDAPLQDYVLELGVVRRNRRAYHLCVDATRYCGQPDPSPVNAALYNHACHDTTVQLRRPPDCTLPCLVAYARSELADGCRLLWDYDGGRPSGGFTVGPGERALLQADGAVFTPCACRGALPCPRNRWFRVFPAV